MLAAKNSTIMSKEHKHRRTLSPERAQLDFAAAAFRQDNIGEPTTYGLQHDLAFPFNIHPKPLSIV
jgi:hypothetical protein